MKTPEPNRGLSDIIYGVAENSINRRVLIGGAMAFVARPGGAQEYRDPMDDAVAVELARIKALRRTGAACIPMKRMMARRPTASAGISLGDASYAVHKPFGEGMIQQRIRSSGTVGDPALRWPRTIDIAQDGKSYFKLVIDSFTIEPA